TAHLSFIILILAPPPAARPPPFPYTTLFRSKSSLVKSQRTEEPSRRITVTAHALPSGSRDPRPHPRSHPGTDRRTRAGWGHRERSEEHTSELQSRENLVCRLLLEKKNTTQTS